MKQRGRKQQARENVVAFEDALKPRAPDDLTDDEKAAFNDIIATRSADYFDAASLPLLKEYVRVISEADHIAGLINDHIELQGNVRDLKDLTGMRDRAQKRLSALATKMRLAQQSRYVPDHKKPKGGDNPLGGAAPWEN